ncbi:hypothetical protein [Bradyrhizobium sp. CB3481]|uniref:hypothetical protein n=1 Tax=Bradyrhizobium sp. CB3481 TaxID=3039158 RepID=UPI0024B1438F|nr:hypothetical protein [Bradyrhizobium sp. CB3481]WFU19664.1 hypothetical protein QA643_15680 [Bradyrhizobium sp. CB3481]
MKQLQLIQILSINACGAGTAGVGDGKADGINRLWPVPNSEKAASDRADTAFEAEKSGLFDGWRFTAR